MKIREVIQEMWNFLYTLAFVDLLMKALILFLVLAIVLSFIPWVNWKWAFLAALVYLVIKAKLTNVNINVIEKKTPVLRDKLSAAADNLEDKNELIGELFQEVVKDVKKVKTADFFNSTLFLRRFSVLFFLCCLLILSTVVATNVDFIEIGDYVKNLDVVKRFTENPDVDINFLEDEALTLKKNVELVKTEFDLPLEVAFNQMDISKVGGVEEKEFSENDYPMEIEAISDISYDETIKKKHRLIVKKYFEAINY